MDNFSTHPLYKIHTIDSAINSLGKFYSKNFLILFITSFVISLGMQLLTLTFNFRELMTITDPMEMLDKLRGMILPIAAVSLVSLLLTCILHYYVIYNPIDSSVNIFTAAYRSLRYYLPYLIIMILFTFMASFAMLLGLIALIIGILFAAVYVVTLYLFILPILMVEGPHIGNALSRTFTLAHRNFWSNIGWVAIFIILLVVISILLSGILLIPFAGKFFSILTNPGEAANAMNIYSNPIFIILSALVNSLYLPFLPIFATILYFNGKAREEDSGVVRSTGDEPDQVKAEDLYAPPKPEDKAD